MTEETVEATTEEAVEEEVAETAEEEEEAVESVEEEAGGAGVPDVELRLWLWMSASKGTVAGRTEVALALPGKMTIAIKVRT